MIEKIRKLAQFVTYRELRNAILGTSVVLGGLSLALLTLYAHRTGNLQLAGIAAAASLAFVFLIIIFVIPPLARSASAEASQLNLPFEFTTGGAIFIGILIIVAFAAWNTGNNLLFLVLSFITSALVVSFIIGNICLRKLDVRMRFPETVFAEVETPIVVGLNNRKRLFPTYSVTAEVRGKEREFSKYLDEFREVLSDKLAKRIARPPTLKHTLDYFVYISRKKSVENEVTHVFNKRGRFMIRDFELSTRFPFGFFRHRRRLSAQRAEIIIFPKLISVEDFVADFPIDVGRLATTRRGMGNDLFALRDYQPTDGLRYVDWKATARSSRLTVREFAAENEKRIRVVFDPHIDEAKADREKSLRERITEEQASNTLSMTEKRFEKGVSKAASILSYFEEEDAETSLTIKSETSEFRSGAEHLNDLLKRLALVESVYSKPDISSFAKDLDSVSGDFPECQNYLVTTLDENQIPTEISRRFTIISF